MNKYIKQTDPFSILYQPYYSTSHCDSYQEFHDFIVLCYCIIHCILLHYCTFYSIVLWTYGTCISLDIELYLAIQLFSGSAASMLQ